MLQASCRAALFHPQNGLRAALKQKNPCTASALTPVRPDVSVVGAVGSGDAWPGCGPRIPPKRGTSTPAQAATARRRRATTPTAPRASRPNPEGSGTAAPNSVKAAEAWLTPVGAGLPTTSSKMNLSTSMRPNSPEDRPVATTSNHPDVAAPPLTPESWRVKATTRAIWAGEPPTTLSAPPPPATRA